MEKQGLVSWSYLWLMANQSSFPAVTWYTHSWTWLEKKLVTVFFSFCFFELWFRKAKKKEEKQDFYPLEYILFYFYHSNE